MRLLLIVEFCIDVIRIDNKLFNVPGHLTKFENANAEKRN